MTRDELVEKIEDGVLSCTEKQNKTIIVHGE